MEHATSTNRNLFPRIQVFISSKCGDEDRYDHMRAELATKLKDSGVFNPYLWEHGGASTLNAKDNYTSHINNSDICVIVIDNADGIPNGVQTEIDHIRQTRKRALYYFCTERSAEKTNLQNELSGPNGPTYKPVKSMSEIPDQVLYDLQNDILLLYRNWCNNYPATPELTETISTSSISSLPKATTSNLIGLRETFGQFIFGKSTGQKPSSELDAEITKLAEALFHIKDSANFDPGKLIKEVSSILPEQHVSIIEKRWQAIRQYLNGQPAAAISTLDETLQLAKTICKEPWLEKDILIDLRNISSEQSFSLGINNEYQTQLANSKEDVFYPLLDRAVSSSFETIEKDRLKEGLKHYTSYTIGDNAMRFIDPICKSFAIAVCFGSLTHISLTVNRLRHVVFYLRTKYQDANLNTTLLKLSIVCGKRGDADKVIQSFDDMRFDSDPKSAEKVFEFCTRYNCLGKSEIAIFEAFGTTGIYLNDAAFARASASFIQNAENAIKEEYPSSSKQASIFAAMRSNSNRLYLSWMVDFAQRAIETECDTWQREALNFISHAEIKFNQLEKAQLDSLLEALKIAACSSNNDIHEHICNAIIAIGDKTNGIPTESLKPIVTLLPKRLQEHCANSERMVGNDACLAYLASCDIDKIVDDNETQGKNGCYYLGIDHHVIAAKRIESMNEPSLELGQRLYNASLQTLKSSTYHCLGKIKACEAICKMIRLFKQKVTNNQKEIESLFADRETLLSSRCIQNESHLELNLWLCAVGLLSGIRKENDLIRCLSLTYEEDVKTKVNAGDAISYLVLNDNSNPYTSNEMQGFLFAYSCYLSKSLHFQLTIRGLKLLSLFLRNNAFRHAAAQSLYDGYAGESPRGKYIIIDAIPIIEEFDKTMADELRSRVLRDSTTLAVEYLNRLEDNPEMNSLANSNH